MQCCNMFNMLQQLTDLCVGRNIEAPVSVAPGNRMVTVDSHGICTMFFRHDFGTLIL